MKENIGKSGKSIIFLIIFAAILFCFTFILTFAAPAPIADAATISIQDGRTSPQERSLTKYEYKLTFVITDTLASNVTQANAAKCYFFAVMDYRCDTSKDVTYVGFEGSSNGASRVTDGQTIKIMLNKDIVTNKGKTVTYIFESTKMVAQIGVYNGTTGTKKYGGTISLLINNSVKIVKSYTDIGKQSSKYGSVTADSLSSVSCAASTSTINIPKSGQTEAFVSVYATSNYGVDLYTNSYTNSDYKVAAKVYAPDVSTTSPADLSGISLAFENYNGGQRIKLTVDNNANKNTDNKLKIRIKGYVYKGSSLIPENDSAHFETDITLVRTDYKVTFNTGGIGSAPANQTVTHGKTTELPTLSADGYTFLGWSEASGGSIVSNPVTVTADKTYYASWKPNEYSISYELNGGAIINIGYATKYTYGKGQSLPTVVLKTGFKFNGWYTAASGGEKVTAVSATDIGNKTFYAQYTEKTAISLDESAQTYTYDNSAKAFQLKGTHAALSGFTIGYYDENNSKVVDPTSAGSYTVTISRSETEEHKFYYKSIEGGLVIEKADPTVTPQVASGTLYTSSPFPAISTTAGDTAGTIKWNDGQTLTAGTNNYTWTFTPTDTSNYNSATGSVSIAVTAVALQSISAQFDQTGITVYTYMAIDELKSVIQSGLTVTGTNNDGSSYNGGANITDYMLSLAQGSTKLLKGSNTVTVNYQGKTATFTLTAVEKNLTSIVVTVQPTYKNYVAFQQFSTKDMVITAYYSNGESEAVTAFDVKYATADNTSFRAGETSVTISYTEHGITQTATISGITVSKLRGPKPTIVGTYTYTGNEQSIVLKDFESEVMNISGNTQTNAVTDKPVIISLKDTQNYEWADQSTDPVTLKWTINKVQLTPSVSGITSKTYDGTTDATGTIELAGAVNRENPTASGTFVWTNANAGTTTVHVTNITLGEGWTTNYELSATALNNQSYLNVKINKVKLTPKVSGLISKTYDGNKNATGTIGLSGAVNGESPTVTGVLVWTSANTGTTTVNVSNITLGEGWETNYELTLNLLSNQTYGDAKISKVILIPSVSGIESKTYDGTTGATGTISLTGAVNNELPTVTGTFVWTSANAGTTTVNVSNITLGDSWETNYELSVNLLSNQTYGDAKISKVVLIPSVSSITSKPYDGTTDATGTIGLSGWVNGENPTASGTFVWTSANAGTTTVHVTNITLGSNWTTNYELSATTLDNQAYSAAKISKVKLTPSVSSITSKDYDGTTDATGTIGLYGAVNEENPTATATFVWTSANAGTRTVNVTDITLGSNWSINYELLETTLENTPYKNAKINKVVLIPSVSGIDSKAYDGNTTATGTIGLYGSVNEESPTATATFIWTSANAGTNTVDVSNITLGEGWDTNYELSVTALGNQSELYAEIKKVTLTPSVSGITSKTYDGNISAKGTISLTGAVNEESPTATAIFTWISSDAGTTAVNVSFISLADAWKTNYELSTNSLHNQSFGDAKINHATITDNGAFTNYSGNYDKSAHTIGYNAEKISVVNSQTVTVYYSTDQENWKTEVINYTDFTDGAKIVFWKVSAPNHTDITGSNSITIAKKAITVTADEKISRHKEDLTKLTYTVSPALCSGDAFTGALATDADKAVVGEYDIMQGTLFAGNNYDITFVKAKYTVIEKLTVIITQTAQNFTYDGEGKEFVIAGTKLSGFTVEYFVSGAYTKTAPVNADSYRVKVTRDEDANHYAFSVEIAGGLVIATQKVAKPAENTDTFTYTGEPLTYTLKVDERYTISDNVRTEAGQQTVTVTLNDKANYEWTGGGTGDVTFTFTIATQKVEKPQENASTFTYTGEPLTYTLKADERYTIADNVRTEAGQQTVTITLKDKANYEWMGGGIADVTFTFTIDTQKVEKPQDNASTFTYTGEPLTYTLKADERYTIADNVRTEAGQQTVTITLKDKANYEWTDGGADDVTFTFTIGKGAAQITVDDTAIVKTYGDVWTLPEASSNFGTVVCDTTVAQMKNAGSYTVTFTVQGTDNYNGDSKRISVTIDKQKVAIPDADTTVFVEDGSQKTYEIAADERYAVSGNTASEVGNYTVTVSLNDIANYEWTDGTTSEITYPFIVRQPAIAEKIDENSEKEHVIVSATDGFAPEVAVEVTAVAELSQGGDAVAKSEKVSAIYDVKLLVNGVLTQPDGTITIKFLIPDECVGTAFRLLHIHGGQAIEMDYTIDGDYAVVTTDKLSEFVFVTDNTGSILWLIILLAVLLLAEAGLAAIKLRKNKKGKKGLKTYSFAPLLLAVFIPAGEIATAAVLGALVLAGGVYNAYLWFVKKNKPQDIKLTEEEPIISADTASDDLGNEAENITVYRNDETDLTHIHDNDEEKEVFKGVETKTGLAIIVRYRKSFTAKLIQASDETKNYYGTLKNAILSYKKVTSRVSWNYDSITVGRTKFAKFGVIGKTLYLYLALDPEDYFDTKYKVERAKSKNYADTPCLYKIKNDRRAKYALDLIAALAEIRGLVKGEASHEDYYLDYETTEALIEKELIKELISKQKYEDWMKKQERSEIDGKRRSIISASEADAILRDEVAAALITKIRSNSAIGKKEKAIVNIDSISEKYREGDIVNLQTLKEKGLIGKKVNYFKVLARGKLDKPLTVEADEFSIEAVKMILLTGGNPIKLSR